MDDNNWLKWGVIGLAVVGGMLLIGAALSSSGELEGRTWVVTEMNVDGSAATPIEGTVISATFEDGTVSGIASCNNYFGSYETDGDSITFGPMGTTLMACIPEILAQEQAYLALLAGVDTYDVDGDTMTLSSGDTVLISYAEAVAETR